MCICAPHVDLAPQRLEEGVTYPGAGVRDGCGLRIKLRSAGRALSALHQLAISLAPNFFKKEYLLSKFIHVCGCMSLCAPFVCRCSQGPEEGVIASGLRVTVSCEHWKPNLDLLKEQ